MNNNFLAPTYYLDNVKYRIINEKRTTYGCTDDNREFPELDHYQTTSRKIFVLNVHMHVFIGDIEFFLLQATSFRSVCVLCLYFRVTIAQWSLALILAQ